MPSLAKDNPLRPAADKMENLRRTLLDLVKSVLAKMRPMVKLLVKFIKNVQASVKEIISKVGKKAVNTLLSAADEVIAVYYRLEKMGNEALKLSGKILNTIYKAAAPEKVFKAVKSLVGRFVRMFREILAFVSKLVAALNPIGAVLKIIDTFKMVLRMMLAWITSVSGVSSAVNKSISLTKKAIKALKAEMKNATQLLKDVNTLKPA